MIGFMVTPPGAAAMLNIAIAALGVLAVAPATLLCPDCPGGC